VRSLIRSAAYLADERIDVNGDPFFVRWCSQRRAPACGGHDAENSRDVYVWIDKKDEVIWKETDHREGPLYPSTTCRIHDGSNGVV